jgi:hypothetical protein
MAAAVLAKFRVEIFTDPKALQTFVVKNDSPVNSIVSIVADNDGKYVLFYLIA